MAVDPRPELLQGTLVATATGLALVPILTGYFGMSFEEGIATSLLIAGAGGSAIAADLGARNGTAVGAEHATPDHERPATDQPHQLVSRPFRCVRSSKPSDINSA